jgi:glycerol-3-phosphate cytidylyltransferase-like family protein
MQVHEPVALLQAIEADTGPCADAILGIPCVFDLESVERINVSQSKMGNKWRFGRWEGAQEQLKRYFRKVEKRRGKLEESLEVEAASRYFRQTTWVSEPIVCHVRRSASIRGPHQCNTARCVRAGVTSENVWHRP